MKIIPNTLSWASVGIASLVQAVNMRICHTDWLANYRLRLCGVL